MTHCSDWLMVHFPAPLLKTCDIRSSGGAATDRRVLMWWVWERTHTGNGGFHYVWGNAGAVGLWPGCSSHSAFCVSEWQRERTGFLLPPGSSCLTCGPSFLYPGNRRGHFITKFLFFLLITADIPLSECSPDFHKSSTSCHFTDFLKGRCLHLNPGCDYRKEQVWLKPVQQEDFLWINAFWLWVNITLLWPSLCKLGIVF